MRHMLILAALLLAAPLRAALIVPEAGLPAGRVSAPLIGFAFQPVSADRWAALQNVVNFGLPKNLGLSQWAVLPEEKGRLAAAPLEMALPPLFWNDAAQFEALSPARRAQLLEAFQSARERVGRVIDRRAEGALRDAQEKISAGKFGEEDLAEIAGKLEALSIHGEKARAAALEVRSALAFSKARREAAAFGSKTDPGTVAGKPSSARTALAPSSAEKAPEAGAPVPAPKPVGSKHWALKVGLIAAGTYLLDIGTKAFAHAHLFSVFHEVAWRKPLMMFVVPYILFAAFTALTKLPHGQQDIHWSWRRVGSRGAGVSGWFGFTKEPLPGLNEVAQSHPSMFKTFSHFEIAVGFMIGGLLGNGIDAFIKNGALDWIPVGRSLMNFADVAILIGLSYFQLASIFFTSAARAARSKKAMALDLTMFLGLPLVGFFIAWAFGSGKTDVALDLAMKNIGFIYLMGFSMLIGIARFIAALLFRSDVKKFNDETK